jgi:hypothetical protein
VRPDSITASSTLPVSRNARAIMLGALSTFIEAIFLPVSSTNADPRGFHRQVQSTELREWFGHDPARWAEFQKRHRAKLRQHTEELDRIHDLAETQTVTLVNSAHDEEPMTWWF